MVHQIKPPTMNLPGSNKSKITKNKNGESIPHLQIFEVVLVHCNLVNNDYQQDSRILYTFVSNVFILYTYKFKYTFIYICLDNCRV